MPAPKRSATTTMLRVGSLSRSIGWTIKNLTPSRSGVFFVDQTVPTTFPRNIRVWSLESGVWSPSHVLDSGLQTPDSRLCLREDLRGLAHLAGGGGDDGVRVRHGQRLPARLRTGSARLTLTQEAVNDLRDLVAAHALAERRGDGLTGGRGDVFSQSSRRPVATSRNRRSLARHGPRLEGDALDVHQVPRRDVVGGDVAAPRAAAQRHRRGQGGREADCAVRRRRV